MSVSEFCHTINFDGTELFARPDTLSYLNDWRYTIKVIPNYEIKKLQNYIETGNGIYLFTNIGDPTEGHLPL